MKESWRIGPSHPLPTASRMAARPLRTIHLLRPPFDVSTDASGNITNWLIFLQNNSGSPYLVTNTVATVNPGNGVSGPFPRDFANYPQGCCGEYQAANSFDAGTWAMSSGTSAVPEPRDVGFIILGLMAMAAVARSRAGRMGSQDA